MGKVHYIPLGMPFIKGLVEGLSLQESLSLANTVILMPTHRGCLTLKEAIGRSHTKESTILPRILPLTEFQDVSLALIGKMPPSFTVMQPLQRLGLMTQLVKPFLGESCSIAHAHQLAQSLLTFLDEVITSAVPLQALRDLDVGAYAQHWQKNAGFLSILTEHWPQILKEYKAVEPAYAERETLLWLAHELEISALDKPVVLAGSTGTRPAVTRLMQAIMSLEGGNVILPSYDPTASEVSATHPHYPLQCLVKILSGLPTPWVQQVSPSRHQLIHDAMVETTEYVWKNSGPSDPTLSFIEATNGQDEARAIALLLRRLHCENPQQKMTLVTPSPSLQKRVIAELRRWGMTANTSSGTPLHETVVGRFMLGSAVFMADPSLLQLVSLLKHPLVFASKRKIHFKHLRNFESYHRKTGLVKSATAALEHSYEEPLQQWVQEILEVIGTLRSEKQPFATHLKAHFDLMLGLTEGTVWKKQDGAEAEVFFAELQAIAWAYPPVSPKDYAAMLQQLMARVSVRSISAAGSEIHILGTLEARLMTTDVVILGGLNEGVWPRTPMEQPWLNRAMRAQVGLPPLERKLALSAHDFVGCLAYPKVFLTRSREEGGVPAAPSRLWQRLKTYMGASVEEPFLLDQATTQTPYAHQAPLAPKHLLPSKLSATAIERLLRDPYSIYAQYILGLKALPLLEEEPIATLKGQLFHKVMEYAEEGCELKDILKRLDHNLPAAKAFWHRQLERIVDWYLENYDPDQALYREIKGELEVETPHGSFTMAAQADCIRMDKSGLAYIVDYKTGALPLQSEIAAGLSPQLFLEAWILKEGGFPGVPKPREIKLSYWHLTGQTPPVLVKELSDIDVTLEIVQEKVLAALEVLLDPMRPFEICADENLRPKYNDYEHLERVG